MSKIDLPKGRRFNLQFNPKEPTEFIKEKFFLLEPESCEIDSKSSKEFMIKFKTSSVGVKKALFVAYPYIEKKYFNNNNTVNRVEIIKLTELAFEVIGTGVDPQLKIDKKPKEGGEIVYSFVCHSYGHSPQLSRSVLLLNQDKIILKVATELEGPFKLTNEEPLSCVLGSHKYRIGPNQNLSLGVKYLMPDIRDQSVWPMKMLNKDKGKLKIYLESGRMQEIFFEVTLLRPKLNLFINNEAIKYRYTTIDFGTTNVESYVEREFYLINESNVDCRWKLKYVKYKGLAVTGHATTTNEEKEDLIKVDEADIFQFNQGEGLLEGPSLTVRSIPLGGVLPSVANEQNERLRPMLMKVRFKVTD